MAITRIHVFGASGSGSSTLGRALAEHFRCTCFDADDYFWQPTEPPFQQKVERAERIERLKADLTAADSWVLSGCIAGWGDWIIPMLTLSVFVQLDPEVRMSRLLAREQAQFGARIEPAGDMYQSHRGFMAWAKSYDTAEPPIRSLALHKLWMESQSAPVICLNSEDEVAELVRQVDVFLG